MLRMAVIQSTPFCNIDCKYCYLPNRDKKGIIGDDLLTLIFRRLATAPFLSDKLEILWHCGEPLVAGISFYERALKLQKSIFDSRVQVSNTIQTNATLLTPEWCDFFRKHKFSIGVSLDGPAFIHDHSRTFRGGRGTFNRAMRGTKLFQNAGVRFGCLSVLTSFSIKYPDELFEFYTTGEFSWVGFNVEEQEGVHGPSSLVGMHILYRTFLDQFIGLWDRAGQPFVLREIGDMIGVMHDIRRCSRIEDACRKPDETIPFRIISFDLNGTVFDFFTRTVIGARR